MYECAKKILIYNPEERAKREPVLGERTGSLNFQRGNCIAEHTFIYAIAAKAVRRRRLALKHSQETYC